MNSWGKRFVVVAFFGWLATPLVLLVLGLESGFPELEKRPPADVPPVAFAGFADARYYTGVARAFGDRVPLRVEAVALDSWVDLEVFGDSPNSDVLLGEEDWFFEFNSVVGPCRRPTQPRPAVAKIRKISRTLHASGRRLVFLVAPDKAAIYPERLGTSAALGRCGNPSRRRLRARLQAAELPGYIDLWQAMGGLKARSDELVYWPHDTHWTSAGALEATRWIIDRVDPALWDEDAVFSKAGDRKRGNLTDMIGLPSWLEATRHGVRRGVRVKVERQHIGGFRLFTNTGEVTRFDPHVLSVHDSFGQIYREMVTQYLTQSTWVPWHRFATARMTAIVDEFARADVVILEVLEHNLISLFTDRFEDLPTHLVGRLLEELPVTDLELPSEALEDGSQEFILPAVARGTDRYLVVDVASPSGGAGSSGLQITIRNKESRPWRKIEAIEVASSDGPQLVAELPWPKLTMKLRAEPGRIRSVGVIDLDDG